MLVMYGVKVDQMLELTMILLVTFSPLMNPGLYLAGGGNPSSWAGILSHVVVPQIVMFVLTAHGSSTALV